MITALKSFTVTLDITEADIRHGQNGDCYKCPGARAAMRALAPLGIETAEFMTGSSAVGLVKPGTIGLNYDEPSYVARHSAELKEWITNFDKRVHVCPAQFDVTYSLTGAYRG